MLDSIIKDLKDRFGSMIGKIIAIIIIFILVIAMGKWAWNKAFGDDKETMRDTIANQSQVIDTITDINEQENAKRDLDRKADEVAKEDLVEHVTKRVEEEKEFDKLISKVDKKYEPPKKVVRAPSKTQTDTTGSTTVVEAEDPKAEAEETARQQRNAVLLQDTLWEAYERANQAPT